MRRRMFCFRCAILLTAALLLAGWTRSASAGGPSYYAPSYPPNYPPGYYYAPQPGYPAPPRPRVYACDGSETFLGGLLGALTGGLFGSAISQHHGRPDPGATLFGMLTGAMLGAAIASSNCP
jgi:hypothetical protein